LTLLLVELGETAREHDTGVVFLIDEMQFLRREEIEAIAAAMHRISQKNLPVALVGTGLPQLPGLMVDAKSYAERLFSYPRIGHLTEAAARQALVDPANAQGVQYEAAALDKMIELSACYPAFIQAYGKQVWNMAPASPIALADVGGGAVGRHKARRRVLSRSLREGHAQRAALHECDGLSRRGSIQDTRCRQEAWRQLWRLHAPRLAHQEGPDLQP
jgi:hypothetical protein